MFEKLICVKSHELQHGQQQDPAPSLDQRPILIQTGE